MSDTATEGAPGTLPPLLETARGLLDQLRAEIATLRETACVLESLHDALRSADLERLRALQAPQEELAGRLEAHRQALAVVSDSLRARLDTPGPLRLSLLAPHLPSPLARELAAVVEQARQVAGQVDGLNRRNALLARVGLAVLRDSLAGLLGPPVGHYDLRGRQVMMPAGRLLETRG